MESFKLYLIVALIVLSNTFISINELYFEKPNFVVSAYLFIRIFIEIKLSSAY